MLAECAKIDWYPIDALPHDTVPYTTAGIELYRHDEVFATAGW